MVKRALVTGGAGFIGGHLAHRLVRECYEVVVLDNLSSGKRENVPDEARLVVGSVTDPLAALGSLFGRGHFDVAFHLAALPRVQYSIDHPEETYAVNATGTLRMLEYCRSNEVPRFVFSSSSSVYGNQERLPLTESMPLSPMSPYAAQKAIGEALCAAWRASYGLETISLRYFNVFGPRQSADGGYACLIPKVAQACLSGQAPELWGDGSHTRDFTYVDDVVEANLAAARVTYSDAFGKAYNIGAGTGYSVLQVMNSIQNLLGTSIEPLRKPEVTEPAHTRADIGLARMVFGWAPQVSFEKGLARTVAWFKENHEM
ncbi:MAG: NAD-dependent epimerase/dehydratase family protein [Nanoarchaeota archaeon]